MTRPRLLPAGLLCAGLISAASAQPTPAAPPPRPEEPENEVRLPEFQVQGSLVNDYVAAESITGTRVASRLQDLPFSVQVVTGEFISDFAAFTLGEQFAYVSSFSPSEIESYQLRGFEADAQLRNGFRRLGLVDKINVDRAEVIKGPAASIYGRILPGGVINILTEQPTTKPTYQLSLGAGTNDFARAEFSASGPLSSQLFYRLDLAADKRRSRQDFRRRDQSTGAVNLVWRPDRSASVSLEVERLVRDEARGNPVAPKLQPGTLDPYREQPATGTPRTYNRFVGLAEEIFWFNHQTPQEFNDRWITTATLTAEKRFSPLYSVRAGAYIYDRDFSRQWVSGDQFNPVTRQIINRQPVWRPIAERGGAVQIDNLFSFATGPVDHRLLVTFDFNRAGEEPLELRMSTSTAGGLRNSANNPLFNTRNLSVDTPNYTLVAYPDNPALYDEVREDQENISDNYGVFVSERASFLDGRVIALGGIRYDQVENSIEDRLNRRNTDYSVDATTWQAGLNITPLRWLTFYANSSTSFTPQPRFNVDGTVLPNEEGEGQEVGLKVVTPDRKFSVTTSYFNIERTNLARETTDSTTNQRVVVLSGKERSRGYEIDANWNPFEGLVWVAGLGIVEAETLENIEFPFLIGTPPRRAPRTNFGTALRYEVRSGPLKGLTLTAGVTAFSRSIVNPGSGRNLTPSTSNPVINNRMPNGILPYPELPEGARVTSGRAVRVDDGRDVLYNEGYSKVDVGASYRFRAWGLRHRVQVNVKNLLDERYTFGSGQQGEPLEVLGTYTLSY